MIKQVNLIFVWCLFMSFLHPCSILPETPHGFVLFCCFKCQNVLQSNSQTGVHTDTTETNCKLCQGQSSSSKKPFKNTLTDVLATWRQYINSYSLHNTKIFDRNTCYKVLCQHLPVYILRQLCYLCLWPTATHTTTMFFNYVLLMTDCCTIRAIPLKTQVTVWGTRSFTRGPEFHFNMTWTVNLNTSDTTNRNELMKLSDSTHKRYSHVLDRSVCMDSKSVAIAIPLQTLEFHVVQYHSTQIYTHADAIFKCVTI